jgi:hypothetical protein
MAEQVESTQINAKAASVAGIGILLLLFLVLAFLAATFRSSLSTPPPVAADFPAPSIRTDERAQRLELERQQMERLSVGNGRIPIEEAMKMITARGARAFDPLAETQR